VTAPQGNVVPLQRAVPDGGLMAQGTWQPDGERITVCLDLKRGVQTLKF
jgi:hypothetical protein